MNFIKLLRTKKSVFTVDDLKIILDTTNEATIRNYLSRAKSKGLVENIYYGVWKLTDKDADIFEIACKLIKNSYISFETVLKKEGVIFQFYGDTVFLASDKSIEKVAKGIKYKSFKLKNSILLNPVGIKNVGSYSIAGIERAICDRLYLSHNYYFDNLENVDFNKLKEISMIYNKRVQLEVNNLIKKYVK